MKKNNLMFILSVFISSFFLIIAFGSGSSDKPKACDCVYIIYEGPDMTWFMKDETDDAMMHRWEKVRLSSSTIHQTSITTLPTFFHVGPPDSKEPFSVIKVVTE